MLRQYVAGAYTCYFEPLTLTTIMMRFLRNHAEIITGVCVIISLALFGLLMYLLTQG